MMDDTFRNHESGQHADEPTIEVADGVDSATLARLMAEVRNGGETQPTAYNRMHNRHNRS